MNVRHLFHAGIKSDADAVVLDEVVLDAQSGGVGQENRRAVLVVFHDRVFNGHVAAAPDDRALERAADDFETVAVEGEVVPFHDDCGAGESLAVQITHEGDALTDGPAAAGVVSVGRSAGEGEREKSTTGVKVHPGPL